MCDSLRCKLLRVMMSSGRWANLPISDQEQEHLAATTTTVRPTMGLVDGLLELRKRTGPLIREVNENNRVVCYYQHMDSDAQLPFLCELGCCPHGCCLVGERQNEYNTYAWAMGLLFAVIVTILVSIIALLGVYFFNKRKSRELKQRIMASHTESSNVSQISSPASYYYPDGYYPYNKEVHPF